jgi:hypothetical protein
MFSGATQHDGLWVSTKSRPLTDGAIWHIVTNRARAAFGQPVNPHLFHSCAATTIAILDPGRIGVARDLLGHVSLATTQVHYIKARSIEASRLYAKVLAEACAIPNKVRSADFGGSIETKTRCARGILSNSIWTAPGKLLRQSYASIRQIGSWQRGPAEFQ